MKFEELLKVYNFRVEWLKRIKPNISEEYYKGACDMLFSMFRDMKDLTDFTPNIIREGKSQFLLYRDTKYEIFNDDYGQCLFIVTDDGEEFSGGTYTCAEIAAYDFCLAIDIKIHERLLGI